MGKSSLGRVVDPCALDAGAGPRARLCVEVPASWLAEGADLAITAPARLACARCDGGGCDTCERSGALRAPADAAARLVHASVSPAGAQLRIALRILHPFGPDHGIEQLLIELRVAGAPSACVARIEPPAPVAPATSGDLMRASEPLAWPALLAMVVLAVLCALFVR